MLGAWGRRAYTFSESEETTTACNQRLILEGRKSYHCCTCRRMFEETSRVDLDFVGYNPKKFGPVAE